MKVNEFEVSKEYGINFNYKSILAYNRSGIPNPNTINHGHLSRLLGDLMATRPDLDLPYNLGMQFNVRQQGSYRRRPGDTVVPDVLRFIEWAKKLPRGLALAGSGRGAMSPYEPKWDIISKKWPDLHKYFVWRKKAYAAACEYLRPVGFRPCRMEHRHVMEMRPRRPRRAGLLWAVETLERFMERGSHSGELHTGYLRGYREVRDRFVEQIRIVKQIAELPAEYQRHAKVFEVLGIDSLRSLTPDNSDGFECVVDSRPVFEKAGARVYRYAKKHADGSPLLGMIVKLGARSYHLERMSFYEWENLKRYAGNGEYVDLDMRNLISKAIESWRRQQQAEKQAAKSEKEILRKIGAQGPAQVIVFRADSFRAGNCAPGTDAWAREHGYNNACPYAIVAASGRPEARRVAGVV